MISQFQKGTEPFCKAIVSKKVMWALFPVECKYFVSIKVDPELIRFPLTCWCSVK